MFIDIRAGMCYTIANKDGMTVKNQSQIRQTGEREEIMDTIHLYITLYEELFDVSNNMDDLMDLIVVKCSGEQAESLLIPFLRDEIRGGYSKSALEYYAATTPSSVLGSMDSEKRGQFIKSIYRNRRTK